MLIGNSSFRFWLKRAMWSRWWAAAEKPPCCMPCPGIAPHKGWRVLVSTTTHILQPGENYAADEAALAVPLGGRAHMPWPVSRQSRAS